MHAVIARKIERDSKLLKIPREGVPVQAIVAMNHGVDYRFLDDAHRNSMPSFESCAGQRQALCELVLDRIDSLPELPELIQELLKAAQKQVSDMQAKVDLLDSMVPSAAEVQGRRSSARKG